MGKEYMTAVEFAKRIGVSSMTVGRWVKKGLIKPAMVTPSGRGKYSEDMVEAYFNGTLAPADGGGDTEKVSE